MSDSQEWPPYSDNPNAPKIPYRLYFDEKANFAGYLISMVLYGFLIMLFFKCMTALFDPAHRRGERTKWGLASYTVVIFFLGNVQTAMSLQRISLAYIDNREFPGVEGAIPPAPGPTGYQTVVVVHEAISVVPTVMFTLCNWLADGLLLYRCYIIYSRNLWAIAFPCLVYIGSLAMGIVFDYQNSVLSLNGTPWAGLPSFTISLSLNILLTLMIIARLVLHARDTRIALGMTGIGGLCTAIVTMLVESCMLYAVSSLLVIGPWGANSSITNVFLPILNQTQIIAPLLIIQRVANKSALTSNTILSGRINEFKAGGRGGLADDSDALSGENPADFVDELGMNSGELGIGAETKTNSNWDKD